MNIQVQYTIDPSEMAKASFIFSEKKPLVLYTLIFLNIIAFFLMVILFTKGFLLGMNASECVLAIGVSTWYFLRKPFVRWLLNRKIRKLNTLGKQMRIDISPNGVTWGGDGIRQGSLAWQHMSYILALKNGYIIPFNLSRFLWVPFSGMKSSSEIEKIESLIQEKRVKLRQYSKLAC